MPKRKTYEKVKKAFEDRGYILLETEYINAHTKMRYICKKHPETVQEIKYNGIQQGRGCKKCGYEIVSDKLRQYKKTPYDKVKTKFEKVGLTLLTDENDYMSCSNPIMRFICSCSPDIKQQKHGQLFNTRHIALFVLTQTKTKSDEVSNIRNLYKDAKKKDIFLFQL